MANAAIDRGSRIPRRKPQRMRWETNGNLPRIGRLPEDDVLIEELREGSEEALETLFKKFHGKIHGLAMSILKNESDAEEATQDVFLTVFRKANTFKGNSALYSWIYRICVNACLMRLRRKRRHETVSIEEFMPVFTEDGMHANPVVDWSDEVERKMLDKELGRVIGRFTDDLSEKYRVIFLLNDVEGLSNEETAQILGLTVPAVKSRLHRARLYLRERLSRYLRDGKDGATWLREERDATSRGTGDRPRESIQGGSPGRRTEKQEENPEVQPRHARPPGRSPPGKGVPGNG